MEGLTPTPGPKAATRRRPVDSASVSWTRAGQAVPKVSRARSLRTSTWLTPIRRSAAVRPGEPRPVAKRSSTAWTNRASPGEPQGTLVWVAQRTVSSDCMGSSIGRPHRYSPRRDPGTASTMPSPALRLSQAVASRQWAGTSANAPAGVTPAVATGSAVSATSPAQTAWTGRRSRAGQARGRDARPSATGSRMSASNLCRLRKAASGPSNRSLTCPVHGWASASACPAVTITTPATRDRVKNPRSGVAGRAIPAMPSPATSAVSTIITGAVACSKAAGSHGRPSTGRKEIQLEVPRRAFSSEVTPVVASAVSMNGRKEKM